MAGLPSAAWLPAGLDPLRVAIVRRLMSYLGEVEESPGSNRGPFVDECNRHFGSPLGSFWCGNFVGRVWSEEGAAFPHPPGSTQEWVRWAKEKGLWRERPAYRPQPGDAVLYGSLGLAHHIGGVVRVDPVILSVEGNTTFSTQFSRNGIGVGMKQVLAPSDPRVLGFVVPIRA